MLPRESSAAWAAFGQVSVFAIAGLTSLLSAGYLGAAEWGVVATFNAVVALITVLSALGYPTQIARYPALIARFGDLARRLPLLIAAVLISAITVNLVLSQPGAVIEKLPGGAFAALSLSAIVALLLAHNEWVFAAFQGRSRLRELAILRIGSVLIPGVSVLVVATQSATAIDAVVTLLVSNMVYSCVVLASYVFAAWRRSDVALAPSAPTKGATTRQLLGAYFASIGLLLALRVDVLVTSLRFDADLVGTFALGLLLAETSWFVANGSAIALLPVLTGATGPMLSRAVRSHRRWALASSAIVSIILGTVAIPIIELLTQQAFSHLALYLWTLAPGMVAFAAAKIDLTNFMSQGLWARVVAISLAVSTMKTVLILTLPIDFGPTVPAIASTLSYIVGAMLVYVVARKMPAGGVHADS